MKTTAAPHHPLSLQPTVADLADKAQAHSPHSPTPQAGTESQAQPEATHPDELLAQAISAMLLGGEHGAC